MAEPDTHRETAGLRGAFWDPARVPHGVALTVHPLRTQDGNVVSGYLLKRGGGTVQLWEWIGDEAATTFSY